MNQAGTIPGKLVFSPRYWLLWPGLGLLRLMTSLPYGLQTRIAPLLGRIIYLGSARWRRIARVNIELCFPELDSGQRHKLLLDHFTSLGMMLLEAGLSWWAPDDKLKKIVRLEGEEHLAEADRQGKGIILLGAHYTTLEISGSLLALTLGRRFHTVYRPHRNRLLDYIIVRGRERRMERPIGRDDIKTMLRFLKQKKIVWYAQDQNYGLKHSLFSPFFNVPAATNTATSRLAKISDALVFPFASRRLPGNGGYLLTISPPLANFPSEDVQQDTDLINKTIEQGVRKAPEQYLWIHRRFKDRPDGQASVYPSSTSDG